MEVRPRRAHDLRSLQAIARAVHESDGYPLYTPDDDFAGLLNAPEAIAAWVAVAADKIIGQVSLHSRSSEEVMALATDRLALEANQLGVVARLIVDPSRRREGAARALLDTAERDALCRGLSPILDVIDQFGPAIALYERQGWKRIGTVRIDRPNDTAIHEHVYAAPHR